MGCAYVCVCCYAWVCRARTCIRALSRLHFYFVVIPHEKDGNSDSNSNTMTIQMHKSSHRSHTDIVHAAGNNITPPESIGEANENTQRERERGKKRAEKKSIEPTNRIYYFCTRFVGVCILYKLLTDQWSLTFYQLLFLYLPPSTQCHKGKLIKNEKLRKLKLIDKTKHLFYHRTPDDQ